MMYSAYKLNKQGDNIQPWRGGKELDMTKCLNWTDCYLICPIAVMYAGIPIESSKFYW